MEIPQVEAFLAVGTFGGFRRAAEALRVTQPAVSARIKALEESLGVTLFERGRRHGLALSAAGRALRPHAEQLLQAVAAGPPGRARPAAGQRRRHPDRRGAVDLHVSPARRPQALSGRAPGRDDHRALRPLQGSAGDGAGAGRPRSGLARSLHHPEVETVSLRDDPLILVGRAGHAVARAAPGPARGDGGPAADLLRPRLERLDATQGLFRRAGLVPNVVLEVETIETAKRMVERGMGLAFLPAAGGRARDPPAPACVAIEIATPSR